MRVRSLSARFVALLIATTTCCVVTPMAHASAAPDARSGPWIRPVAGPVARSFVAPRSSYGPGHRGADFAVRSGTPVRAANTGEVTFAGAVGGSLHVVIAHAGGLRTSYSFLADVAVRRGQHVSAGDVVGAAGAGVDDHAGRFHLGLRIGDRYVDPMALFAPTDLTRLIRLIPVHAPSQTGFDPPAVEARSLAQSLHLPQGVPGVAADEPSGPLDAIGDVLADVGDLARTASAPMRELLGPVVDRMWRSSPLKPFVADARAMAERLLAWARSRQDCVGDVAAPASGGGSGHLAITVAGINSTTDPRTGTALPLDTTRLGYRDGEVQSFSYAPDGGPYAKQATWTDLHVASAGLATQLRALQRAHPGREVDLIAHSQGGVVVADFLANVYKVGDASFPPLGTVVTLSSPLRGAPAATGVKRVGATATGRAALRQVDRVDGGAIPPTSGTATRQLAEDSRLIRELTRESLPDQIDLTSIGAADDVVVPADHAAFAGGRSVTVNPVGVSDHSAILRDSTALAAARLALEARPLPCVGVAAGVRGAIEPVVISRVEHTAGDIGAAAARASDSLLGIGATP